MRDCGWLAHVDICKAGKFVTWSFVDGITSRMAERPHPNTLVDLNLVTRMKSRILLIAYLMVQSKNEMMYPMFEMVVSETHSKVQRRNLIRALTQLATPLGATFHVAPCYHRDRPELGRLGVKAVTENTRWNGHALMNFDRKAGITVIRPRKEAPASAR